MGMRRVCTAAGLAVALGGACAGGEPAGPRAADPGQTSVRAGPSTSTTMAVAPGTTAPSSTTTATARPAAPAGDLPVQSSDEQRCAIAAAAGVPLETCPG